MRFSKAFKVLDRLDDDKFDQYVKRKLRPWYAKFPPTPSSTADGGAGNDESDGGGAAGGGSGPDDSGLEMSGGEE